MEDIKQKLHQLHDARNRLSLLTAQKQELVDNLIPQAVKDQMEEIEVEFGKSIDSLAEGINLLEREVKSMALELGESVKGDDLHVVLFKGKVSWDSKGLEGFAVAHPEINAFKKVGSPYCSIKAVKKS